MCVLGRVTGGVKEEDSSDKVEGQKISSSE
jgi:hypothetical protein